MSEASKRRDNLTPFLRTVIVSANNEVEADKVLSARVDHDEDLREDGVEDYTIEANEGDTHIVVAGNLSDGFAFFGPFVDFEDADDFSRDILSECWIATCVNPKNAT